MLAHTRISIKHREQIPAHQPFPSLKQLITPSLRQYKRAVAAAVAAGDSAVGKKLVNVAFPDDASGQIQASLSVASNYSLSSVYIKKPLGLVLAGK
jgi:hypothetical protein